MRQLRQEEEAREVVALLRRARDSTRRVMRAEERSKGRTEEDTGPVAAEVQAYSGIFMRAVGRRPHIDELGEILDDGR